MKGFTYSKKRPFVQLQYSGDSEHDNHKFALIENPMYAQDSAKIKLNVRHLCRKLRAIEPRGGVFKRIKKLGMA